MPKHKQLHSEGSTAATSIQEPVYTPALNVEQPAHTGIYLDYADLDELATYLGRPILSRQQLMEGASRLSSISVQGAEITLEPGLISRLQSRCHSTTPFDEFLQEIVVNQLHIYVGW